MAVLLADLAAKFKSNLNRHSIVTASRWAEEYRMMGQPFPGKWSTRTHPWLKGMMESKSPKNVGKKGAQLGFTEAVLNITFFQLDVHKRDVLYLLPNTRPDAADFATGRVDKAIELSEHLTKLFSTTSNIGFKKAGGANLYIRGANSKSGLKSVPTGVMIFDEFDEMDQDKIDLAEERKSGQTFKLDWKISTPTVPDYGIDLLFNESTKEHFFFPCPCCSKHIQLKFPDNLVITSDFHDDPKIMETHIICGECKNKLPHELKHTYLPKGDWVAENKNNITRGFYVNQLYSATLEPWELAKLFLKSKLSQIAEQEFHNSKMGMAYIVAGARITDEMINELVKGYPMAEGCRSEYVTTMGVDVGNKIIHVEIDAWDLTKASPLDINADAKCQCLWAGELKDWEQLDKLMTQYAIKFCVVDAQPETRNAMQFAMRFYGRVKLCRYNPHVAARQLAVSKDNENEEVWVSVHRTSWLDQALGRFRNKSIILPNNLPLDYKGHIKAPIRRPTRNKDGEPVYKYETQNNIADHYAHARVYSEVALPFATGSRQFVTISKDV